MVTLEACAIAMAASTSRTDVTQTGQPGPERSVMLFGITSRMPCLKISTVWVPQTSMSLRGLLMRFVSAWSSSSICFILDSEFRIPNSALLESLPDQIRLPQGDACVVTGHGAVHHDVHAVLGKKFQDSFQQIPVLERASAQDHVPEPDSFGDIPRHRSHDSCYGVMKFRRDDRRRRIPEVIDDADDCRRKIRDSITVFLPELNPILSVDSLLRKGFQRHGRFSFEGIQIADAEKR